MDPSDWVIELLDQQLDLANATDVRSCDDLSPLLIERKTT
jgi:hypothetical protein